MPRKARQSPPRTPALAARLTPLEQAQELVFEAFEATTQKQAVALVRQALEISRDCVDAFLILAEESDSVVEAHALIVEAVAAGTRVLGDSLETLAAEGMMWLTLETRPYLRALGELAAIEWEMGDRQAALAHGWELLRLNPNDNQGIRFVQLTRLLQAGSLEQIERLLSAYPDEAAAAFAFGRALHLYRSRGEGEDADTALRAAKRANRHVVGFLLNERALPAENPEFIVFGEESEAIACAFDTILIWGDTPGALDWLESKRGPSSTRPRGKRR